MLLKGFGSRIESLVGGFGDGQLANRAQPCVWSQIFTRSSTNATISHPGSFLYKCNSGAGQLRQPTLKVRWRPCLHRSMQHLYTAQYCAIPLHRNDDTMMTCPKFGMLIAHALEKCQHSLKGSFVRHFRASCSSTFVQI